MKILITSFLVSMLVNAKGQVTDEGGWKVYMDNEFFFTMKYPPDWEFHSDIPNLKFMIYAPRESDTNIYRASISADAFSLPPGTEKTSVKEFAETSFAQLRKMMKDCEVMVTKDISVNDVPRFLVVASGMVDGKYLFFKQVYCVYNRIAYIVSYTGQAGRKDPYTLIAGDMLDSFKPQKVLNQ